MLRADDAGGGTALDHADRPRGRFRDRDQAAIALHHEHGFAIAAVAEELRQFREIGLRHAADIGVDHGGGRALVFAGHRRHLRRDRHVHLRRQAVDDVADALLVLGIAERPEQAHADGFDLLLADQPLDRRLDVALVERLHDRALVVDALAHAGDSRIGHQRRPAGSTRPDA